MSSESGGIEWAAASVWGGERRAESPQAQHHHLPADEAVGRGASDLFLVIEGVGDDSCLLFGKTLVQALLDDPEAPPASALSRALRAACVRLETHALAPARELIALGASAVLIQEHGMVLAQLLPAQVYLLQQGQGTLRMWPDTPVPAPMGEAFRRGGARRWDLEIEHARATPRLGATLLISTSELAVRLRPSHVRRALDQDSAEQAATWLCTHLARGAPHFEALVVRTAPAATSEAGWAEGQEDLGPEWEEAVESDAPPARPRPARAGYGRSVSSAPAAGFSGVVANAWQRLNEMLQGRLRLILIGLVAVIFLIFILSRVIGAGPAQEVAASPTPNPQALAAAERAVADLANATDREQGQTAVVEALAKISALDERSGERAAELRSAVEAQSTRIAGLEPPPPPQPSVLSAEQINRPTQFSAVTRFGDRLFVLDAPRAVLAVRPGEGPELLLERGGNKAGQTVGDLAYLVTTTDGVVSIDSTGHYWFLTADDTMRSGRLPGSAAWQRVLGFETYTVNLYAVDTGANQLLRWKPTALGTYALPPDEWFGTSVPAEIVTALDLAIDGDIFVLAANGEITRYRTGEPRPFTLQGLERPLQNPQAITTGVSINSLYVVDTGNSRIVQLAKSGQFERELVGVASPGDTIRDVWVDEAGDRIFVLTEQRLSEYVLPPEGGPTVTLTPVESSAAQGS